MKPRIGTHLVWFVAAVFGFWCLWSYSMKPGQSDRSPVAWPKESKIARSTGLPTLLLFLHPKCPCSRATLAELAQITTKSEKELDTQVIFVAPPGADTKWAES